MGKGIWIYHTLYLKLIIIKLFNYKKYYNILKNLIINKYIFYNFLKYIIEEKIILYKNKN